MSTKEATYHAMNDISAPVVAIALILAAVFVPVGFIPGIVGRLYQQFAITIAISVILSAFTALSLPPALFSLLLRPTNKESKRNWVAPVFAGFDRLFEPMTDPSANLVARTTNAAPSVLVILESMIPDT